MKQEITVYSAIIVVILVSGCVIIGAVLFLYEPPQAYLSAGDRVYYPDELKYGYVIYSWDWPDYLPTQIRYDDGTRSLQIGAREVIKLNDSKYWEFVDFPMYPSPLHGWYAESFMSYHAHPPINDIEGYCVDVYGNYSNRYTCYAKSNDEIVYYPVIALNVSVWKLQKLLNNKSNLNKDIRKARKAHQNYHNFTAIDFSLLQDWMDYYGLVIDNFDEIKDNTVFMNQYCRLYGYAGYDKCKGCYRVY